MAGFGPFLILFFVIPSLLIGIYAVILNKLISALNNKYLRIIAPVVIATSVSILNLKSVPMSLLSLYLAFITGTYFACALITPIPVFERDLPSKYLNVIIIGWSTALLSFLLTGSFGSVMGHGRTFDILGILPMEMLSMIEGKGKYLLTSLINYLEIAVISTIFYWVVSLLTEKEKKTGGV